MTETNKATETVADKADDLIEIVEQVIPASVAVGMLVIGVAIGAAVVLLWAYAEQQKETRPVVDNVVPLENNGSSFGTRVLD